MSEWRRFLHASKSQSKLTMTLPLDYIQKKSAMALCLPEQRTAMETIDKLIDEATSDYATAENWPLIIAVVDKLNAVLDDEVRDEAARMVRMRLANPSTTVVLAALHLVEAIVKNCGKGMRQRIAKPKFMHTLEMLYKEHATKRGRDSLEIQARTLELVQAWGEAFLPFRRDFAGFVDTYHKMRIQGVHFPTQYDTTRAPVLSPPRGQEDNPFAFAAGKGLRSRTNQVEDEPAPSAYKDLPPEDTYHVTKNIMDMMDDMLHECSKTNYATLHSNDILQDLAVQLKQLEKRLVVVIEQEANRNGTHLEKYLSLNDEVQQAMLHYKEACAIAAKHVTSPPASRKHKQDDTTQDDDLIKEGVLSPRKAAKSTFADDRATSTKPATTDDDDDDPFAAFAKERVQKLSAAAPSVGVAAPSVGPLISFDDDAPVVAPVAVPATKKDDAPLIFWDDDLTSTPAPLPNAPSSFNPFDSPRGLAPATPFVPMAAPPATKPPANPFDLLFD